MDQKNNRDKHITSNEYLFSYFYVKIIKQLHVIYYVICVCVCLVWLCPRLASEKFITVGEEFRCLKKARPWTHCTEFK